MPTPTTYSSAQQFVSVGKETTQGTAAVSTVTVPVDKFDPEIKPVPLDDSAMRGSMVEVSNRVQGVSHVEWSLSGPMFVDTLGYFLANILGDITTTGSAAPYSHAISTLNSGTAQPGSLTFIDQEGPVATVHARTYTGCCLSELTLKGNAASSLITVDCKGIGWKGAPAASTPTSAPSTEQALAGWRYLLGLAGPAAGGTLVSTTGEFELTIKRDVKAEFTGQNSQYPYIVQRGKAGVAGKLAFTAPADDSALTYLLNNTQPQLQLLVGNGVTPTSDAAYRALQIDVQKAAWDTSKPNRGSTTVGYDTTFVGIASSTNAGASGGTSPIKVTLTNAIAAATY